MIYSYFSINVAYIINAFIQYICIYNGVFYMKYYQLQHIIVDDP